MQMFNSIGFVVDMTCMQKFWVLLLGLGSVYGSHEKENNRSNINECDSVTILNEGPESLGLFPSEIHLLLVMFPHGEKIRLPLTQNDKLHLDSVAVHIIGDDGKTTQNKDLPPHGNIRFYHGFSRDAVISMRVVHYRPGTVKAFFKGTLTHNGKRYKLEPRDALNHTDSEVVVHQLCQLPPEKQTQSRSMIPLRDRKTSVQDADVQDTDRVQDMEKAKDAEKSEHPRVKRDSSVKREVMYMDEYHVEMGLVVDHSIWDDMMEYTSSNRKAATSELMQYLGHLVNGVNMIYRSIPESYHFKIHIWLKEIYIAETREASTWTVKSIMSESYRPKNTAVNATKALEFLEEWRNKEGRNWTHPDHVQLITRYDINSDTSSFVLLGLADHGAICFPRLASSVIEDGGLDTFQVAAHELAHNLGAHHDSFDDEYYVMSPERYSLNQLAVSAYIARSFRFSNSSVLAFKSVLSGSKDGYPRVCLHNKVCQQSSLPTKNYTLDEQCQMAVGPHSFSCDSSYDELSDVCLSLMCYVGQSSCSEASYGQDGTFCGTASLFSYFDYFREPYNKYCQNGICGRKPTVSKADEVRCKTTSLSIPPSKECVVDDPEYVTRYTWDDHSIFFHGYTNNKTHVTELINCRDVVRIIPWMCFERFNSTARFSCCRSCHQFGLVNHTGGDPFPPLEIPQNRTPDVIELTNPPTTTRTTTTNSASPEDLNSIAPTRTSNTLTPDLIELTNPPTTTPTITPEATAARQSEYHSIDRDTLTISLVSVSGLVIVACVITVLVHCYLRRKSAVEPDQRELIPQITEREEPITP